MEGVEQSLEISKQVRDAVSIINAKTGVSLTSEQSEVAYRFNDSMSVFANPGTGKTTTAVTGLIAAQTIHGISGKKINAMSFTKLATAEIAARYKEACNKCNIVANVNFATFHSICFKIIKKAYPNFSIKNQSRKDRENELKDFAEFLKDEGVAKYDDMFFVKQVYESISKLNNEMLYSKSSVENSAKFMDLQEDITIKQFQITRARWFKRNFIAQTITPGDIPTMVLFVLLINPDVAEEYKKEFELMVVDEFQDMSVLYLDILARISQRLIVIGDIKQQIYGFNGASLMILDAYKSMFPDAPVLELNQSFRCKEEIVELSNKVIAPNNIEGYLNFKGVSEGGKVDIVENSPDVFNGIIKELKRKQDNKEYSDVMFLSRNNASVVPIIEKLYRENIIFRTTKFAKVMDLPIFKELCIMADIALNSKDSDSVSKINRIFPEFKWLSPTENPILEVMRISKRESDKDLLTMNYSFNMDSSYVIINKLRRFVTLNEQKQPFHISMQPLYEIYEDYVIEGKWWRLDRSPEYYLNLVESIIKDKTYDEMIYDEHEKFNKNEYYTSMNEGIRCYTFHSSKGLEADEVFILDLDEGVVPKDKSITDLINKGCVLDAAKEVRNERNLLYVAFTRCKSKLTVVHNGDLAQLVKSPDTNGYRFLDDIWEEQAVLTNETNAFKLLLGLKGD